MCIVSSLAKDIIVWIWNVWMKPLDGSILSRWWQRAAKLMGRSAALILLTEGGSQSEPQSSGSDRDTTVQCLLRGEQAVIQTGANKGWGKWATIISAYGIGGCMDPPEAEGWRRWCFFQQYSATGSTGAGRRSHKTMTPTASCLLPMFFDCLPRNLDKRIECCVYSLFVCRPKSKTDRCSSSSMAD